MKMKDNICHIYAWVLMAFMLVLPACDRTEDNLMPEGQVRLKASLSPMLSTVYTKGDGEIKSNHSASLNIGLARSEGENAGFNSVDTSNDVYGAKMEGYTSENMGLREITFNEFQPFPTGGTTVNYIGWYPYEGTTYNKDGEKTVVNIPVDGSTDILYSDVATGNRLGGFNTMTFRHALVKYSVMVYGTEESAGSVRSTWGQIQSVVLNDMYPKCALTLPSTSVSEGKPAVPMITSSGTPVDLTLAKTGDIPIGFSNAMEMGYILAPAPSDNILNIKIITTEKTIENLNLSVSSTFQPGKHYQIYLRFSPEGVINAEVKVSQWQISQDINMVSHNGIFYDLSETHTANSYIVSAPNSYCFNATVRGNGYTGIVGIPGADVDLYMVGDPVSAEIVWTDLVDDADDNLDQYFTLSPNVVDGRVFFSVKPKSESSNLLKKEGNVVIGVKDAAGNMLWTWHIWITDRPAEQGYKNGFVVQDRDLGATAYAPTGGNGTIEGFYYQWGRPTPLPLGKTVYKPVYDETTGKPNTPISAFEISNESIPVINRVAQPTTYFTMPATASDALLTKNLWGWRSETDEYSKTIYDPCPPGYRVPSIRLWRDLSIKNVASADGAVSFDIDVSGLKVYYPMTGYYMPYGESWPQVGLPANPDWAQTTNYRPVDNGTGAYMWAATYDLGQKLNDASDDHPYSLDFEKAGNDFNQMETRVEMSNYAMPVRCVSRMSKAHVTDLSDYQTANSYIVSKKGYYKFKATVRGNGIGQLVSPGSTSTIVLTEQLQTVDMKSQLVKVEPLWWHSYADSAVPTNKSFDMLNEGKPDQDGFVSFEIKEMKEGNMILAGYDAKGAIIWSWHIWITDEPAMMKSNSFVVMDRNLGATFAPSGTTAPESSALLNETYGFYYQWGRKDPFVVPGTAVYKYSAGSYNADTDAFTTISDGAYKTVGNSVANPMTYHTASADTYETVYNKNELMSNTWNSPFDLSYNNTAEDQCFSTMIHPEDRQSLWGYSAATGYGVTTTKTMYDPCPPGYMVAHYLVWTNTERDWNNLYYSSLDGGFRTHSSTNVPSKGLFLTNWSGLFDPAWFPYSGYINGKSFTIGEQGSMGIFHTSTPAGNGARSLMYNSTKSGQGVDDGYRGLPTSYGYPVRCQKE